jgi:hypothetical protein
MKRFPARSVGNPGIGVDGYQITVGLVFASGNRWERNEATL